MLGVTFTTSEEADPFIKQYIDGRFDGLDEGEQVWVDKILVTVTGPGKIKATLNTERLLQEHDLEILYHAGGATALTSDLEISTLIGVTSVLEGDRVDLDSPAYPRMPLEPPSDLAREGTLVSQDHAAEDMEERSYWARLADIRDTSGYAIAYVAAQHGTSCHIVKGITDRVGVDSSSGERKLVYEEVATFLRERAHVIRNDHF